MLAARPSRPTPTEARKLCLCVAYRFAHVGSGRVHYRLARMVGTEVENEWRFIFAKPSEIGVFRRLVRAHRRDTRAGRFVARHREVLAC